MGAIQGLYESKKLDFLFIQTKNLVFMYVFIFYNKLKFKDIAKHDSDDNVPWEQFYRALPNKLGIAHSQKRNILSITKFSKQKLSQHRNDAKQALSL